MNYEFIGILIIVYLFFIKKNKKEKFYNVDRQCESIYGPNHPKCYQKKEKNNRLEHVGYFKINTIKYPLLDLNVHNNKVRYLMLNNKFYKFKKKYWNRAFYFKNSLYYSKNIPFEFISNFTYRGILVNNPTDRKLYVFGKKINNVNYKYLLFREKNNLLQYAYSIPYRPKILDGDSIFVRNNISTFGPFVFYKN